MSEQIIYLQEDNICINGNIYKINNIDNIDNIDNIKTLIQYLQNKYKSLNIFKNYFIIHNGNIIM